MAGESGAVDWMWPGDESNWMHELDPHNFVSALHDFANSTRYLAELFSEKCWLDELQSDGHRDLHNSQQLLDDEIEHVWNVVCSQALNVGLHPPCRPQNEEATSVTNETDGPATAQEKVLIPFDSRHIIVRMLDPRELFVKRLEEVVQCRVLIRGQSSFRDGQRENYMRNSQGWVHIDEPLHVLVIATDITLERCVMKVDRAVHVIENLISTGRDLCQQYHPRRLGVQKRTRRSPNARNAIRTYGRRI